MAMDAKLCSIFAKHPNEHSKKFQKDFLSQVYFLRVVAEVIAKPPQLYDPDKWVPSERHLKMMDELFKDPIAYMEKRKKEQEPDDHS